MLFLQIAPCRYHGGFCRGSGFYAATSTFIKKIFSDAIPSTKYTITAIICIIAHVSALPLPIGLKCLSSSPHTLKIPLFNFSVSMQVSTRIDPPRHRSFSSRYPLLARYLHRVRSPSRFGRSFDDRKTAVEISIAHWSQLTVMLTLWIWHQCDPLQGRDEKDDGGGPMAA